MKSINDLIQLSVPVLRRPCSDAPEADYRGDWGPQHPQDGPSFETKNWRTWCEARRSREPCLVDVDAYLGFIVEIPSGNLT